MHRNNQFTVYPKFYLYAGCAFVFLLLSRVISLFLVPLNDVTEARYGEIARKMLETGNWVTPLHDYGVPFWAKPPLSTWLSAASMKLFGISEAAVRLPGLLLSLGILWLVFDLTKKKNGTAFAVFSVLVLLGTFYFFLNAGTVMTDPALLFCTTLSTVSFWYAMNAGNKLWSYVFFVGLGLGMLAKGPIALVLVGFSIFCWVLWRRQWIDLWKKLPWFSGTLIFLCIALPWYLLAEYKTPGFLQYFIVGEHIQRFLTPGWIGDKYGMAHDAPAGMIWVYAVLGIFPWCFLGLGWIICYWKKIPSLCRDNDGWMSFLICCSLAPLVFFTFSKNIIYPYVFPILPTYAILFSELWVRTAQKHFQVNMVLGASTITGILFLIGTYLFQFQPNLVGKTQKPIINAWAAQHPNPDSTLLYWDYKTDFSAQFYSRGKAKATDRTVELCHLLSNGMENYFVVNKADIQYIPAELFSKFVPIQTFKINGTDLMLLRTPVLLC